MFYLLLKSLHIIGVVCWFAGLFYIVRLFIYDVEASLQSEPHKSILQNQLRIMERRLWYGITVPSMLLTVVCGTAVITMIPSYLKAPNYWMHFKLLLVVLLLGYHFHCGAILKQLKNNTCKKTSHQLRIFNEYATILLLGIVFAVVLRSISASLISTGVLVALGVVIFVIYSKVRKKTQQN